MKKFLFILILIFPIRAYTQWINSITVFPANPTITDSVYLIADCSFPSGSCDQHTQGFTQNGYSISSWALHCVGMLAFICGHTDTFSLGTLAAGTYQASFHLDHGSGPFPCSPGFVPGPTDSISFNVSILTSVSHPENNFSDISVYPNPCREVLHVKNCKRESEKKLFDLLGREVASFRGNELQVKNLKPGIYILVCDHEKRKIIIE